MLIFLVAHLNLRSQENQTLYLNHFIPTNEDTLLAEDLTYKLKSTLDNSYDVIVDSIPGFIASDSIVNTYESAKNSAQKFNTDFVLQGDVNSTNQIIALTIFLYDSKNDNYEHTFSFAFDKNHETIEKVTKRFATLLENYQDYNKHTKVLFLEKWYREMYSGNKTALIVLSDVTHTKVNLNGKYMGISPLIIMNLNYNKYSIETINPSFAIKKEYTATLLSNRPYTYSVLLKPTWLDITSPTGAKLSIDGKYVTETPVNNFLYHTDFTRINISKNGYFNKEMHYSASAYKNNKIEIELNPKSKNKAFLYSALFPGSGQYYIDQEIKGYIFGMVALAGLSG